jgi:IS1 family transposase
MNVLSTERRAQVISALVEGNSINAITRMTGVAKHTVLNLLRDLGSACAEYHDRNVRNLHVRRMQADEIWQFVGAKKKNTTPEQKQDGWGDAWTWVAIDADTKLCISYLVGLRDKGCAYEFIQDCAERIIGRPQITTDSLKAYPDAIEAAFGADVTTRNCTRFMGHQATRRRGIVPQHALGRI